MHSYAEAIPKPFLLCIMLIISSVHRITSLVSASTAPGAESGTLGCLVHHQSLRLCMQRSLKIFGMQDMVLHICGAAGSSVHRVNDVTAQCWSPTSWASVYTGPVCRSRPTLLPESPRAPETAEAATLKTCGMQDMAVHICHDTTMVVQGAH